jgi:tetratricopeptide (TPR) repeat protein
MRIEAHYFENHYKSFRRCYRMDIIEKGKKLAQEGNYEKGNPDLHFYLGLCYSSLEEFPYAKYHYEKALTLQPDHAKTNIVFSSLNDVEAAKPPERDSHRPARDNIKPPKKKAPVQEKKQTATPQTQQKHKSNLTDKKWEDAFPDDVIKTEEKSNVIWKILFMIIGIVIVACLVYYGLAYFE